MSVDRDSAFQMSASNLRFGSGVTREVGMDLEDLGVKRTLVLIDPALKSLPAGESVLEALTSSRVDFDLFDRVQVEPTDRSFQEAAEAADGGRV